MEKLDKLEAMIKTKLDFYRGCVEEEKNLEELSAVVIARIHKAEALNEVLKLIEDLRNVK